MPRFQVGCLSRRWASITITEHHMEWLCWRLSVENRLYVSPRKPVDISWRGLFQDLWQYRDTWKEEADTTMGASSAASAAFSKEDRLMDPSTAEAKTFIERLEAASKRLADSPVLRRPPTPIKVHVRFRPPTNRHDKADGSKGEGKEIVLPLHQKLQLLKVRDEIQGLTLILILQSPSPLLCHEDQRHFTQAQKAGGKALTSKQALERLTKAGGWFGSRWTEEERVKVVARKQMNEHADSRDAHAHVLIRWRIVSLDSMSAIYLGINTHYLTCPRPGGPWTRRQPLRRRRR